MFLLLSAAFFPKHAATVMFCMTLLSWIVVLLVAKLLRSTVIRGEATPFVMELPPYRMPTFRGVFMHTWERAWQYMKKAGTVILGISILIWASMTFPGVPGDLSSQFQERRTEVETRMAATVAQPEIQQQLHEELVSIENQQAQAALRYSFAGRVGSFFEPLTRMAGFDWRTNIALLGGFAAKEVIVASLGTVYSMGDVDTQDSDSLGSRLTADPLWSPVTALSLMVFVLLYAPCFVTVAVISRETSWKWAVFSVVFNTVLAFTLASGVYQVGRALF